MKFASLALIATVSAITSTPVAFNTNEYDVDLNGNVFKKTVLPKELTLKDIKNYK